MASMHQYNHQVCALILLPGSGKFWNFGHDPAEERRASFRNYRGQADSYPPAHQAPRRSQSLIAGSTSGCPFWKIIAEKIFQQAGKGRHRSIPSLRTDPRPCLGMLNLANQCTAFHDDPNDSCGKEECRSL